MTSWCDTDSVLFSSKYSNFSKIFSPCSLVRGLKFWIKLMMLLILSSFNCEFNILWMSSIFLLCDDNSIIVESFVILFELEVLLRFIWSTSSSSVSYLVSLLLLICFFWDLLEPGSLNLKKENLSYTKIITLKPSHLRAIFSLL